MNQWKKLTTFDLPLYRQNPKVNKASLQWKKLTLRSADGDPTFERASVFFHMATTESSHGVVMLVQESHYGHKVSTTNLVRETQKVHLL